MILSAKTLIKFARGGASYTSDKGVFRAFRFSEEQIKYMKSNAFDQGWTAWAMHTGAVRLEFKTDATKISFDYVSSSYIKESNTVDFIVDGKLEAVYRVDDSPKGHIEHTMAKGEKKIVICLPCIASFGIKKFTINGGYKSVPFPKKKILILGDSITHGGGPLMSSATYVNMLAMKTGYEIIGQGIAGYRYEPREKMMVCDGFNPDKVVVFLGTNYYEADHIEQGYDYKKAVYEYYDKLVKLYPTTPILCVTPLWRNNGVDWERFNWCIDTIKSACARYERIKVIDGLDIVPHADEFFADKIHPTAYGSTFIASAIEKALKQI
ncbi:MAG: SGNH/GDSL hydrolase family protein [Ruminococcaceae bacterium]|nr:SGNH/GDSL hydrolase family protein [Oscillospiraceae bacterium]